MNELFLNIFGFLAIISLVLFGIIIVLSILNFLKAKKDMENFLKFYYQATFKSKVLTLCNINEDLAEYKFLGLKRDI